MRRQRQVNASNYTVRSRGRFLTVTVPSVPSYLLLDNGTDKLLTDDGTSKLEM
jgi:hypothetical protein